jgi:hypothetical protein
MTRALARPLRDSVSGRAAALLALVFTLAGLCVAQPARSAGSPGVVVIPRPIAPTGLSYFKVQMRPGHAQRAGAIELRNPGAKPLHVALAAVDGQTLSTLGSGYAPPGSAAHAATLWLHLGRHYVTLAPGQGMAVPVAIVVPARTKPGDYLAGVSIQALGQSAEHSPGKGLAIASVDRYAIGVEVSLPGARRPLIRFTGAALGRQPAGVTFFLQAVNAGNAILQNVAGSALITKGSEVIAHVPLGPGTFVTGTSIAYPILTPHQLPRQGTAYRIRAYLRYAGGIARLDTLVSFGHAAALRQQAYGGPKAPAKSASGLSRWIVALAALALVLGGLGLLLLLRRRRAGARSPLRTLEAAAAASRASGEPLSLITLTFPAGADTATKLAPLLRSRVRRADRICRLGAGRLLIVAPDTDLSTAQALAADLRRHLDRGDGSGGATSEVRSPEAGLSGPELLQLVSQPSGGGRVFTPSG